jgi:hypothetical protein
MASVGLPAIPQGLRGGRRYGFGDDPHHRTAGADLLQTLMLSTGSALFALQVDMF